MTATTTTARPSTRLHEVYDPTRSAIVYCGPSGRCAEYVAKLPTARRERVIVRPAGR